MTKKFVVRLVDEERGVCQEIIKKLNGSAQKFRRAQRLLKTDADGPTWSDVRIAAAFNCRVQTIENLGKRLVTEGFALALEGRKRRDPPTPGKLDGEAEARLIALRWGKPPSGYGHWTLPLLAAEMVTLEIVGAISHETVRKVLKKNGLTKRKIEYWGIPSEQDAAFVACREDVLEIYAEAYDPRHPVLCMDEQPVQLLKETRVPIAATKTHGKRVDYEYERTGTASIFMFSHPVAGWRRVSVRACRTARDGAAEIRLLLEEDFPEEEKIALVCDNLNTLTLASLSKAFAPAKARRLAERLEMHFTPTHGSWLNMAEIELSVLTTQCLNRRIPDLPTLLQETTAWQHHRNTGTKPIDWQFKTADVRIKLNRLYPQIQES